MGRLLTFIARIRKDYKIAEGVITRGVGVDEHTALLLDVNSGDVTTVGVGKAYICSSDHSALICEANKPLTFHGMLIITTTICHSSCPYVAHIRSKFKSCFVIIL